MEKKYYTPNLEDLFIGYEFEFHSGTFKGMFINDPELQKVSDEALEKIPLENRKLWVKETISINPWVGKDMKSALQVLQTGQMRTKYLDKQDIEKEGWDFNPKGIHNSLEKHMSPQYWIDAKKENFDLEKDYPWEFWFKKGNYWLGFYRHIYMVAIVENTTGLPKDNMVRYSGKCKSINELRKICQFLEVK